jgi:hypothetical protein
MTTTNQPSPPDGGTGARARNREAGMTPEATLKARIAELEAASVAISACVAAIEKLLADLHFPTRLADPVSGEK